jgi:hypothetical protein
LDAYRLLEHVAVGHRGDASYKFAGSSPSLADLLERRDGLVWSLDLCYGSHAGFVLGSAQLIFQLQGMSFWGLGHEKKTKRTR